MLQTLVSVSNPFQLYRASFQFGSDCSDCNDTAVATSLIKKIPILMRIIQLRICHEEDIQASTHTGFILKQQDS